MDNQKIDNQLNLALSITEQEREKSLDLDVGYDNLDDMWELIVKYNGSLDRLNQYNIKVIGLMNNYAILRIPQSLINTVANLDEIIYIEKPKRLNFAIQEGINSSCINVLQSDSPESLQVFGKGVLIAIIDSGIDYRHEVFIDSNGKTKILEIWDQSVGNGENVPVYGIGTLYTEEQINQALQNNTQLNPYTVDSSGHGTAVASIASAVAPQSELLIVKLGRSLPNSFPRTSELMMAIDYCVKKSIEMNVPLVINLSFGNNYGGHDGATLIETYIDLAAQSGRTTIIVGTGNEAATAIHSSIVVENEIYIIEFQVGEYESALNLQLWKNYADDFDLQMIPPTGSVLDISAKNLGTSRFLVDNTYLLVYYGEPSPYSQAQEIYFDFIPRDSYIDEGIWKIRIIPRKIVDGKVDMWLPTAATLNDTMFLKSTAEVTLTIPSTSTNVVSVGAYNSYNDSYAAFSGRGYLRGSEIVKPDIVAPGVNIRCASPGGGYVVRSGTSMAAPFVSGSAALLCEWGIVRENDKYLYGEKVKAYLISGARQLSGEATPNPRTGWGALCLADSFPR